jgi:hypothetical protein
MKIPSCNRRLLLLFAAGVVLSGCGDTKRARQEQKYQMGQVVSLGSLSYTAVETEWRDFLDGQEGRRLPKSQFLLIKVVVTNGGGGEVSLPLLTLIDAKGASHLEEDKGDGVPQWLGLLRLLKPAESEEGTLLFDVPPGSYRLRVSTGGDPEKELAGLVEIPYQLDNVRSPSSDLPMAPTPVAPRK